MEINRFDLVSQINSHKSRTIDITQTKDDFMVYIIIVFDIQ